MSTATAKVQPVRITNDYDDCQECGRTGLVRVVVLTNGAHVGTECMKRVCGWKVTVKNVEWMSVFTAVAEKIETADNGDVTAWALWQRNGGGQTRETCNGVLTSVGGCRKTWAQRGWM